MKQIPNELFFAWIEKEIAEGRSVQFRLKGYSMFPLLRNEREEVVLSPCQENELRPMDVVLFRYQGKHVLHRIIRREGSKLYIQGDGSFVAKEECLTSDVVGKVCIVVRPSGKHIDVNSWQWRLPSTMWRRTGIFRKLFLRVLLHIARK